MEILVVEDSATLRQSMKKLIEKIGHKTLFANSGEEALQMVGICNFDLVIMDVEMPGLDGFETTSLMREALDGRWVPIIFATSHTSDESVLAGIEAGGDDYLIKPLSRCLLEAKIKAMHRIAEMQNQLTRLNTELAAFSQYDDLTQLLNRHTFIEKASQSMKEARRHTKPCALLMLDVDFFKQYNDSYGHVSGDECLRQVAGAIQQAAKREIDIVGRYGGEEFIIMLPQTDRDGALLVAQNIISYLEQLAIAHNDSAVSDYVTISIGIEITKPTLQSTLDNLILTADKNLYLAKEQGRNRVIATNQVPRTILIADDNGEHLNLLTEFLQPLGNIITSDNQHESIELAKDIMPDLMLLNIDQPQINGKTVKSTLEQHLRTSHIPVLFISEVTRPDLGNAEGQPDDDAANQYINPSKESGSLLCKRVASLLEQ